MIIIRNIEELEAERKRQIDAWLASGNDASNFILNLTDADLSYANLKGVDLTNANLTDANLTNANLRGADLEGANFTGADFCGADLSSLYIFINESLKPKKTNLKNCNFLFANFKNAILCNCDLRLVKYLSSAYLMYSLKIGAVITPLQETALMITFGIRGSKFMAGFVVKEMQENIGGSYVCL